MGDLYANPTVAPLAAALDELGGTTRRGPTAGCRPSRVKTQTGQLVALLPLRALAGGPLAGLAGPRLHRAVRAGWPGCRRTRGGCWS